MFQFSRLARVILEPDARVSTGLLLAFVALLPAEPLYNAPMIALAALGLIQVLSGRTRLTSPENRFICIAFLCIWLPMLASLPDAVNPAESFRKTASLVIFFLAGVYAVGAYDRFRELDWLVAGVAAICSFWILDALWQFQTGEDWFGFPYTEGARLSGMFYTGRIGNLLATFAPLVFEAIRRARRRWQWSPVLLVPYFMTIALSGSRSSWGVLVIASIGYFLFLVRWSNQPSSDRARRKRGSIAAVSTAMVLAVTLAAFTWSGAAERAWETIEPRVESLSGLWSGDREQFERALSFRPSIWETALNMWSAHWLNGVGPRGFQYAYQDYNPETDYYVLLDRWWLFSKTPHMQLLEIAAETGVIGLVGYVILAIVFLTKLRRLQSDYFRSIYPYALALIVALFPFTGHLGFYGVLSTGVIWWIIIVNAGMFSVVSKKTAQSVTE